MNRRLAGTSVLLLLAVLVVGCAAAPQRGDTKSGSEPRVRCLSDPARDTAEGRRPLFFFFCVESP